MSTFDFSTPFRGFFLLLLETTGDDFEEYSNERPQGNSVEPDRDLKLLNFASFDSVIFILLSVAQDSGYFSLVGISDDLHASERVFSFHNRGPFGYSRVLAGI